MSSSIRKVALISGSGRLGPWILRALAPNYDLTVVTRHSSSSNVQPSGYKVAKVGDDYPERDILPLFKEQDAVVLCLGYQAYQHELPLVKASIAANVKRLILNGYGGNEDNEAARSVFPIANMKGTVLDATKERAKTAPLTWSWTSISCGIFFDLVLTPSMGSGAFFGINQAGRSADLLGDGNYKFSTTNVGTIGESVSKVLAAPNETANRSVFVSSFEVSLNEILAAIKKARGEDNWTVSYTDVDEAVKTATANLKNGPDMQSVAKLGMAVELKDEFGPNFAALGLLDNELLGLNPESVEQTVLTVLKDGLKPVGQL